MKAIVDSVILEKELKLMSSIVRKNIIIPITASALFDFTKNKLKITVTDSETIAISVIDCNCENDFSLVIVFEDILKVCSNVSAPLCIQLKDKSILIESDSCDFTFSKGGEPNHFPATPIDDFDTSIEVEGDFFYHLEKANLCRNKDPLSVNSNMPCVDLKKDVITVAGFNPIYAYIKDFKIKNNTICSIMIPDSFVQMTKSFQETTLSIGSKWVKAEYKTRTIISLLGVNKFVPYMTVLPKSDTVFNLSVDKKDLLRSLQIASIASNITTNLCIFSFIKGGLLKLTAQNLDNNKESNNTISVKHTVDIDMICFHNGNAQNIINIIDAEKIEMAIKAPNKTVYLKPSDDDSVICILQPIFIQE